MIDVCALVNLFLDLQVELSFPGGALPAGLGARELHNKYS